MFSLRALAMTLIGLGGCGLSLYRPYPGLLLLIVLYFFRPDLWGAEVYVRPVLWLTIAVTIGWYHRRRAGEFSPVLPWLAAMLALYAVSTVAAAVSSPSGHQVVAGAGEATAAFFDGAEPLINIAKIFVAVFLICELCDTPRKLAGVMAAFLVGSAWFVKVAVISWAAAGFSDKVRIDTAVGQGGGSNYIAWVLASGVGLLIYKLTCSRGKQRLLAAVMLPLWLVGIVATGSRGGVLCLGAAMFALLLVLRKFKLALVLVVTAAMFVKFVPPSRLERVKTITLDPAKMDDSMLIRYQHVGIGMRMMGDHPLFGTGLGSFPRAKKDYLPLDYAGNETCVAHNTLIQMGCEAGVIFLAVFLMFYVYGVYCLWRRSPEAFTPADADHMDWVRAGLAGAAAATTVQMIKGDIALVDYFWWVLALPVAYHTVRLKAVAAAGARAIESPAETVPKWRRPPWRRPKLEPGG